MDFDTYIWFTIDDRQLRVLQEFDDLLQSTTSVNVQVYRLRRQCTPYDDHGHMFIQVLGGVYHYTYPLTMSAADALHAIGARDPMVAITGCLLEVFSVRLVHT